MPINFGAGVIQRDRRLSVVPGARPLNKCMKNRSCAPPRGRSENQHPRSPEFPYTHREVIRDAFSVPGQRGLLVCPKREFRELRLESGLLTATLVEY